VAPFFVKRGNKKYQF